MGQRKLAHFLNIKMKYLLPILVSFNLYAADISPVKGLYRCVQGNEESICDQRVKPIMVGDRLSAIYIEYVGWCGSMGPYLYPCSNNECRDAAISVKFSDEKHYRWENRPHGFVCDFEKN